MVHKCLHHRRVPIYLKDNLYIGPKFIIDNLDLLITMISTCHTVGFLLVRSNVPLEEQKFGTRSPWVLN